MRGAIAAVLLLAGVFLIRPHSIAGAVLILAGVFVLFEALRGWCALRACGVKTKL